MTERRDPTQPVRPRRPLLLRILIWVILLWTILGWLRFAQVLAERTIIIERLSAGLYWYLLLSGAIWGLTGLPLLWGLLIRAEWARKLFWAAALFYSVSYWLERLILWQDAAGLSNWPFMLVLTAIWLGLSVYFWRSDRVKQYFDQQS